MANNDDLVFAALSAAKHAADGVPDAVADWLSEHVDPETGYVVDDTLTIEGAAADAKAVGDRIESAGLTDAIKQALLQLAAKVAYIDDDGQDYYDDLYAALYNGEYWAVTNTLSGCTTSNAAASVTKNAAYSATITASSGYTLTGATVSITMGGTDITSTAYNNGTISIASVTGALVISVTAAAKTLSSISAVYTQSGTVYDTDSLDSLKSDLVVTATYSDSSTATVPSADYTLSGTLAVGTSTITVSYGGKTTTFNVTVTATPVYPMTLTADSDGVAFGSVDHAKNYTTPPYVSNDQKSRIHAMGTDALGYPINYGKTYRISGSNVYAFAVQTFGATGLTKLQNVQALTDSERNDSGWLTTSGGAITFAPTLVDNEEPLCMWFVGKKDSAGTGKWNALSDVLPFTIEEL